MSNEYSNRNQLEYIDNSKIYSSSKNVNLHQKYNTEKNNELQNQVVVEEGHIKKIDQEINKSSYEFVQSLIKNNLTHEEIMQIILNYNKQNVRSTQKSKIQFMNKLDGNSIEEPTSSKSLLKFCHRSSCNKINVEMNSLKANPIANLQIAHKFDTSKHILRSSSSNLLFSSYHECLNLMAEECFLKSHPFTPKTNEKLFEKRSYHQFYIDQKNFILKRDKKIEQIHQGNKDKETDKIKRIPSICSYSTKLFSRYLENPDEDVFKRLFDHSKVKSKRIEEDFVLNGSQMAAKSNSLFYKIKDTAINQKNQLFTFSPKINSNYRNIQNSTNKLFDGSFDASKLRRIKSQKSLENPDNRNLFTLDKSEMILLLNFNMAFNRAIETYNIKNKFLSKDDMSIINSKCTFFFTFYRKQR